MLEVSLRTPPAYEELLEFLASGPSLKQLRHYHCSARAEYRVHRLLEKEADEQLSEAESAELDCYFRLRDSLEMIQARLREER